VERYHCTFKIRWNC